MSQSDLAGRKVLCHDMCLRDGMHAKREQISTEQMASFAAAMEKANVPMIQVSHGAGLGGNSLQHGFAPHANEEYWDAVAPVLDKTIMSVLLIPGLGTMNELRSAHAHGVRSVHVATHSTEADTSPQHIACGRELGMDTSGFLMMAHLNTPQGLAEEAKKMESYGAQTVYVTDSAGYMLPEDVTEYVTALRDTLEDGTEIGFHGHNNLGMGIANSIAAVRAGASRIDCSVAGLLEAFVAVCDRMGIETGCDMFGLMDMAEELVFPMMDHIVRIDRSSLTLGYAGVYSTFLLHANRLGAKYGIEPRDILLELGRKKMIGGQEDMIEDTALTMLKARESQSAA
jgi:4-hydroxy-2-oxovalerate/4-hydroxy-2-oxohexanoate aldolase